MVSIEIWMVESWATGGPHDLRCFSGDRAAAGQFMAAEKAAGRKAVAWNLMDGQYLPGR